MRALLALLALLPALSLAQSVDMPSCLPKVQWPVAVAYGAVPATVGGGDYYAVYVCDTPGGYVTDSYIGVLATDALNILNFVRGLYSSAQAAADCTATCIPMTPAQVAYLAPIVAISRPMALVAFNGASTTRSVYTTNSDGTLNPTAISGESVAVAGQCDETNRIPSAPTYYSVAGQANATSGAALSVLPTGSFTICVVSLPIGSN